MEERDDRLRILLVFPASLKIQEESANVEVVDRMSARNRA